MAASAEELAQRVEAVRRFNRFYTQQIGILREDYLKSPFPVTEARVIYELAHQGETTASELSSQLGLDPGYLSRVIRSFNQRGLVEKRPSPADGRQNILRLTEQGEEAFALLNSRSRNDIAEMLGRLGDADQRRAVEAMLLIEELLGAREEPKVPYLLRPHQPGDMGWVTHRHGVLYAEEYGWDERFEALVAGIVAKFVEEFDPKRERCWIAEREGEIVGSVFVVKQSDEVAKLRLLLVEPKARGLGIGTRLVDECIRFARRAGYAKMVLWTNSCLLAARQIYEKAGFRLVASEPHRSFGYDLVGENWELDLRSGE